MELGMTQQVADRAPPGDVLAEVFGTRPVLRLQVVPVSLALLAANSAPPTSRDRPRGGLYDPATAPSRLALFLRQGGQVQVASRDGILPPAPLTRLLPTLRRLRQAYPSDHSLVLAASRDTSHGQLLAAASMARRNGEQVLFPGLALAPGSFLPASLEDLSPLLQKQARRPKRGP
jgi:hypothetical protein